MTPAGRRKLDLFTMTCTAALIAGVAWIAAVIARPSQGAQASGGIGEADIALVTLLAAMVAAVVVARVVRRLGREHIDLGGAARNESVGAGAGAQSASTAGIDIEDLAAIATIEAEPPAGIDPSLGGVIASRAIGDHHLCAWLMEQVLIGSIAISAPREGEPPQMRRGPVRADPAVAPTLDAMFADRSEVALSDEDEPFADAWIDLAAAFERWRTSSGLWDERGVRRVRRARRYGRRAVLVGLVVVWQGARWAVESASWWPTLGVAGAMLFGGGAAAALRSWELRSLTPNGTVQWVRIESFRRFVAGAEATDLGALAAAGRLGEYTTWAVALDEIEHWDGVLRAAAADPDLFAGASPPDLAFALQAASVYTATTGLPVFSTDDEVDDPVREVDEPMPGSDTH